MSFSRARLSPQKKLEILKKVFEEGLEVVSVCRLYGISRFSFYKWARVYKKVISDKSQVISKEKILLKLLEAKRPRGCGHFRSIKGKREKLVLEVVLKNPHWSSHQISKYLKSYKNGSYYISNHGVHNILKKHLLNTENLRIEFTGKHPVRSVFSARFSDYEKYLVLQEAEKNGLTISRVCRKFHISRYTYYAWLKKYQEERTIASLAHNRPRGEDHPRFVGDKIRKPVLDLVAANPEYSVHQLHRQLAGISGHHAIRNLLLREGLNTYDRRLAYAQSLPADRQGKVAPQYLPEIPVYRLRHLIAHFATVPRLLFANPKKGIWHLVFGILPLFVFFLWIRLLLGAGPGSSTLGMIFASVALTFGLFFFIYSMKYYITVLMVLKLASSGSANPPVKTDAGNYSTDGNTPGVEEPVSVAGEILARVSNFLHLEGVKAHLPGGLGSQRINPLLINLEKVELEGERPFVSIHVALYNEKRVVERLIQSCTSQAWYTPGNKPGLEEPRKPGLEDGTQQTTDNLEIYTFSKPAGPTVKLIHRFSRSGFKGGALQEALRVCDPRAEYVCVFDADFVPYPDTIEQFVKTFQVLAPIEPINADPSTLRLYSGPLASLRTGYTDSAKSADLDNKPGLGELQTGFEEKRNIAAVQGYPNDSKPGLEGIYKPGLSGSNIAAVQGYQWHVLNKSQTWVTRGVRTEYAGSYVVERSGEEIY